MGIVVLFLIKLYLQETGCRTGLAHRLQFADSKSRSHEEIRQYKPIKIQRHSFRKEFLKLSVLLNFCNSEKKTAEYKSVIQQKVPTQVSNIYKILNKIQVSFPLPTVSSTEIILAARHHLFWTSDKSQSLTALDPGKFLLVSLYQAFSAISFHFSYINPKP